MLDVAKHSETDLLDGNLILSDFPLLAEAGASLHYLDNAATTQKPKQVIDAISDCYRHHNAPVHRGLYPLAEEASQRYEAARASIASFIGAASNKQVIFSRSATESINMVAQGWLRSSLQVGDQVWVSVMEHHANFLPWQAVCRERGGKLCIIELNPDGTLDLESAAGLFGERTKFIALTYVSNVLGVINPIKEIVARAAEHDIPVLIDAAQSVGHMKVDVTALECDFIAFSAHKMFGPSGIGALYAKAQRLEEMEPLLLGGGMVDFVTEKESHWLPYPAKFEAGSQNLADAIGFAAAVDYINSIDLETGHKHVMKLTRYAMDALSNITGVKIYGPPTSDRRAGTISFNLTDVHPHDVAQVAGERGVAIRAGHHCCQPLMQHLGVAAMVRASFAPYNNHADVDALVDAVLAAQAVFA